MPQNYNFFLLSDFYKSRKSFYLDCGNIFKQGIYRSPLNYYSIYCEKGLKMA